ncbi:MAG: cytidine deaminase [Streblomastix strix]|uniref:Cytidine deaminase n=1 Tax=Streblomastix strix TaxID=222440 RepID=A0A5J4WMV0_9EUKA|nr:MAG: cytidine deaminase [Streblomastix strix]
MQSVLSIILILLSVAQDKSVPEPVKPGVWTIKPVPVEYIKAILPPSERENPPFVFTAEQMSEMAEKLMCSQRELLLGLAFLAKPHAVCPISNFGVGAAVLATSGNAYLGVNVEILRMQLAQTIHAEQCAITNSWNNFETGISMIAVTETPCGHCRQFMSELPDFDKFIVLVSGREEKLIGSLISDAFRPSALDIDTGIFGMDIFTYRNLDALLHINQFYSPDMESPDPESMEIANIILNSGFTKSYSPYPTSQRSPSAVGLLIRSDLINDETPKCLQRRLFVGGLLENVAYNPSMQPFQSAIVALLCGTNENRVFITDQNGNKNENISRNEKQEEENQFQRKPIRQLLRKNVKQKNSYSVSQQDPFVRGIVRKLLQEEASWDSLLEKVVLLEDFSGSVTIQREIVKATINTIAPSASFVAFQTTINHQPEALAFANEIKNEENENY